MCFITPGWRSWESRGRHPLGGSSSVACRSLPAPTHNTVLLPLETGFSTLLFGRFARADNARAYGLGGTGLGLYLCRELIERHRGRIWFESAEGQGSTFFIALPLTPYADL